jgi:hypothetical protein
MDEILYGRRGSHPKSDVVAFCGAHTSIFPGLKEGDECAFVAGVGLDLQVWLRIQN